MNHSEKPQPSAADAPSLITESKGVSQNPDVRDHNGSASEDTPLEAAVRAGDLDECRRLYSPDAASHRKVLVLAIKGRAWDVAHWLIPRLSKYQDVACAPDSAGKTALMHIVENYEATTFDAMLKHMGTGLKKYRDHQQNIYGTTALMKIALYKCTEAAEKWWVAFPDAPLNPNLTDEHQATALVLAIQYRAEDLALKLVKRVKSSAELVRKNSSGWDVIGLAARRALPIILGTALEKLSEQPVDASSLCYTKTREPLLSVALRADARTARVVLEAKVSAVRADAENGLGETPFMVCLQKRDSKLFTEVRNAFPDQFDVEHRARDGTSILSMCVTLGHPALFIQLFELSLAAHSGVEVHPANSHHDKFRANLLMLSAVHEPQIAAHLLSRHGDACDVNAKDARGFTLLMHCLKAGRPRLVEHLILERKDVDLNAVTANGVHALDLAMGGDDEHQWVQMLLVAGGDPAKMKSIPRRFQARPGRLLSLEALLCKRSEVKCAIDDVTSPQKPDMGRFATA